MVKTTDVDAVVRSFGGIAGEARTIPFADAGDAFDEAYAVAVCRQGEYVVAIEVNGFQGSRPEVLRRVSRLGETVSAFWNVNALTRFSYAVAGRIKTAFEAGADSWKDGADPECLAPLVAEIDWEAGHRRTGLLLLAARLTGQPFTEDWLSGEVLVAPIAEHLEDVHPVTPGFEPLEYQHPVLAAALHRADDESLLTVARAAVDAVVAVAGLTGAPGGDSEFDELVRMARYEAGWSGYTGYVPDADRLRPVALDAVRALQTAPNPLTAAFKTIDAAKLAKQLDRLDPAPMPAGFLNLLGNPPAPSGADGARAGTGGPLERHAWITGHWLGLAASITYARSVPLDTVAAAFGGIASGAGPVSLTDTEQVALRREDDWTIAIAFNGNVQIGVTFYGTGDILPWTDPTNRFSNIRFDSAGAVAGKHQGAVFVEAKVVVPFSLSSPDFPQSARHYDDAINHPVLTFPSGAKNVPGVATPLHRTLNSDIQTANNNAARQTCDDVWGPYDGNLLNCDEYPFKSTQEGAGKGDGNYSARLIDAQDNQAAGNRLNSYYSSYSAVWCPGGWGVSWG